MRKAASYLIALALCLFAAAADPSPLFDVPQMKNIRVDGDPADWGDRGFRVGILTSPEGDIRPASDLDAGFRLGWDENGLLLLVTVVDNVGNESADAGALYNNDCVELFVAAKQGSPEYYQVIFGPGHDPGQPELRHFFNDRRRTKVPEYLAVQAARTLVETGYVLEVSLPWTNLSITPEKGTELALQLYVTDTDGGDDRFQVMWFPLYGAHSNPSALHRVRLARKPGPPVLAAAGGEYERLRRVRISVYAVGDLAGKAVQIREGKKTLASGKLEADATRASARLVLPVPPRGEAYGELIALVDGQPIATVDLPHPDQQRARALMDIEVHCQPSVFSSAEFPDCVPARPVWVEDLLGLYEVKTTYYDRDYSPVTTAEKPGRYGAVIEIVPEQGRTVRRFRTLFRQPEEVWWWDYEMPISIELPPQLGIDPAVVEEQSDAIAEHFKWRFVDGTRRDDFTAPLLAGLQETTPGRGDPGPFDDVWAQDRQWWVGLKRQLYGTGEVYAEAFVCPRPIQGENAPVLRDGSPEEAGMKPDAADKIDALLQEWAANSDESFAVCIARHGVIVLHQAYGQRGGRPMTVDDRSWMASITKLLSGSLMMMLVDQGLVDLDEPVDKFIPALRDIEVTTPLTVRHLYTHTTGLGDLWGDDLHDFEEIVAEYYPYLEVGQQHSYTGAGYSLAGKVIEAVSGEAIPQFYKHHLLDPLDCANTYVTDNAGGAESIPMDMARIGQMLLNRGAYGDRRFFREETFERMLPVKLTKVLGPDTEIEWGIGATWFNEPGLGEGTFGHGAASSATLRIDPVHDLVIVMTRNAAGTRFNDYHPQFIAAVVDGIAE